MAAQAPTVSIEQFVYELRQDLPRLYKEHPQGISMHVLHEEYGEPIPRILRATQILQEKGAIVIEQMASREHYILPVLPTSHKSQGYKDLTNLQRRMFELLVKSQDPKTHLILTNYAQLSRLLECSQGGVRSSIERLTTLQYLHIHTQAKQGVHFSLILEVHPDKIAVDPNLTS